MTRKEKLLMRVAVAIHEQFTTKHSSRVHLELPAATWQESESLLRRMQQAHERGWQLAAERLRGDLRGMLCQLQGELITIDNTLEPQRNNPLDASSADIYADLIAIDQEFAEVSFNRQIQTISVTTESIELEGVYLGSFEICLDWSNLAEGHPHKYRVLAVDPNPAASNDSVTHPHVQDEAVCEGDGRQLIRNALKQGRLLDFFVIVANLLRTYNPESPYVSLSDWYGQECADCGTTVCDDERWTCEKCGSTVCGGCNYNCPDCDGVFCNECVMPCEGCDENHCCLCMKQCSQCCTERCQGCLNDKERCSNCNDQETQEECDEPAHLEASSGQCAADTPLQPDRLGKTVVPA